MSEFFRCVIAFAVWGPVLGYFAFLLVGILWSEYTDPGTLLTTLAGGAFFTAVFGVIAVPFAWLVGVLPATLTGVIYYLATRPLAAKKLRLPRLLLAALIGAGTTACYAAAMRGTLDGLASADTWQLFVVPGAIAAIICAHFSQTGRSQCRSSASVAP